MFKRMRVLIPFAPVFAFFITPAQAQDSVTLSVTQAERDFWFHYEEESVFKARAYAWQSSQIDSMLWLYDANGNLIAENDDYFGLDSWIEINLQAGSYRLRAGVCCGNPDNWYGNSYTIELNSSPSVSTSTTTEVPTTTTTSTTTTTTTEPPTTTTTEPETTTTWVTTTTTSTTTTLPVVMTSTSTTVSPTTTTESVPTTSTSSVATTNAPVIPPSSVSTVVLPSSSTTEPSTTTTILESPTSTTSTVPSEDPASSASSTLPQNEQDVSIDETLAVEEINDLLNSGDLETLSNEEVATLVESIANADLTDEQAEEIAIALSSAPDDVKEAFEEEVNIFNGQFDAYVPLNSKITVGERRVLVVATATVFALPATATSSGSSRKVRD